jgi:hypothetical protein
MEAGTPRGRDGPASRYLPMSDREHQHVEHDLETALSQLKDAKDPSQRRELFRQMRRLLAEADSLVVTMPKWRTD